MRMRGICVCVCGKWKPTQPAVSQPPVFGASISDNDGEGIIPRSEITISMRSTCFVI